jgi:aldehyde dehydrogenase (NAD+)
MEKHSEELASLETLDNGKPLAMSRDMDVSFSIKYVRSIAGTNRTTY